MPWGRVELPRVLSHWVLNPARPPAIRLMPEAGVEPARLAALGPKPSVSSISPLRLKAYGGQVCQLAPHHFYKMIFDYHQPKPLGGFAFCLYNNH